MTPPWKSWRSAAPRFVVGACVTLSRTDHRLVVCPMAVFATARFARPMVPFGDPREVDPFAIDCLEKGKGRWADMKNWVYDFEHDLPFLAHETWPSH